jgi:bifunctional lysine-specific demethylase and histidyl-hydroxylase MINA
MSLVWNSSLKRLPSRHNVERMDISVQPSAERFTFADLLAPVTPEEFARDVQGKKPLHIPGRSDKFAFAMSWDQLNALLNQTAIWTPRNLNLALDKTVLQPAAYSHETIGRDGNRVLTVDFERVRQLIAQGASLVLNEVETFTPGLKRIAETLGQDPGGKVQCNLYCSWQKHQAFNIHFDTHDVFALQVTGEKVWRIYRRHFKNPVNHPAFKLIPGPVHDANAGPVQMEIVMRPGDLLYIPPGFYHDALAESEATVHLSYSVVQMNGLDIISMLYEQAVMDELFRVPLPRADVRAGATLEEHLMRIAGRMREMLRDPKIRAQLDRLIADFRHPTHRLKLPEDAGY